MHRVSTADTANTGGTTDATDINIQRQNQFGPQSKNLASIMRGLKSSVTRQARQIDSNFAWQPSDIIYYSFNFPPTKLLAKTSVRRWQLGVYYNY